MRSGMQIIAHRGASGVEPEHTLIAYDTARAAGSDGYECDIRLSCDGHLMCLHDRTTERVAVDDHAGVVSAMSRAELLSLNVGTARRPAPPLTLRELLTWFRDCHPLPARAGVPVPRLYIETKHPTRFGPKVEYALYQELQRAHLASGPDAASVSVISFSPQSLARMRLLSPRTHRILLRREFQRLPSPATVGACAPDGVGVSVARAQLHPRLTAGRWPTYLWTADRKDEVQLAARRGVRWMATNLPAQARTWVDEWAEAEQFAGIGAGMSAGYR